MSNKDVRMKRNKVFIYTILSLIISACTPPIEVNLENELLYDYAGYCSVYQNSTLIKPYIIVRKTKDNKINITIDQYYPEIGLYRKVGLVFSRVSAVEGKYNLNDDDIHTSLISYRTGNDILEARYNLNRSSENFINLTEVTDHSVKGFFQASLLRDTSMRKDIQAFLGGSAVYENGFFDAVLQ